MCLPAPFASSVRIVRLGCSMEFHQRYRHGSPASFSTSVSSICSKEMSFRLRSRPRLTTDPVHAPGGQTVGRRLVDHPAGEERVPCRVMRDNETRKPELSAPGPTAVNDELKGASDRRIGN